MNKLLAKPLAYPTYLLLCVCFVPAVCIFVAALFLVPDITTTTIWRTQPTSEENNRTQILGIIEGLIVCIFASFWRLIIVRCQLAKCIYWRTTRICFNRERSFIDLALPEWRLRFPLLSNSFCGCKSQPTTTISDYLVHPPHQLRNKQIRGRL